MVQRIRPPEHVPRALEPLKYAWIGKVPLFVELRPGVSEERLEVHRAHPAVDDGEELFSALLQSYLSKLSRLFTLEAGGRSPREECRRRKL